MQYQITAPQTLTGIITLPASKSISNRALIISALGHNNQTPQNISVCDDTDVMVQALKEMPQTIDIGAAGTAMRFLTAYLAVTPGQHIITGTERMKHRPIGILVDALRTLGAKISYVEQEGFPPLDIQGAPFGPADDRSHHAAWLTASLAGRHHLPPVYRSDIENDA